MVGERPAVDAADNPKVSIGLPVHNAERYLERALECLTRQDYPNLELVVSDNASTDGTWNICRTLAARDTRIRLLRNSENVGVNANFEIVRRAASGRYFGWAAGDDEWEPDFVSSLARELSERPECPLAMCAVEHVDQNSAHVGFIRFDSLNELSPVQLANRIFTPYSEIKRLKYNLLRCGLFRKKILDDVLDQSDPVLDAGDRPFLALVVLAGRARYVERVLYRKRVYDAGFRIRNPDDPVARKTNRLKRRPFGKMFKWMMFSKSHRWRQKLQLILVITRYRSIILCNGSYGVIARSLKGPLSTLAYLIGFR